MPTYTLPAPLAARLEDDGAIVTPADRTTRRRPVLLQLFRENIHGVRPDTAYEIDYKEVGRRENAFGIGAHDRQIRATVKTGSRTHSFDFVICVPRSETPVPVIVHINNRYLIPLDKAVDEMDPFWPVEKFVRRGFCHGRISHIGCRSLQSRRLRGRDPFPAG